MRNTYLRSKTAGDIDKLVGKIIRDLGNPEPPVRMEMVFDRLKLDRKYYSSTEDGFLKDTAHKLKVAGKQILLRPSIIFEAVKKFSLKALLLPDKKRILIDKELPATKQRWAEGHEVCHSIIPWHDNLMLGDTKVTLNPACHHQMETEANYGAGRLLFLQDQFRDYLGSDQMSMKYIKTLASKFGNSITSTLWRAVEHLECPAIGIISGHPKHPPEGFDAGNPCEYFIRSRSFIERFDNVEEVGLFSTVNSYCGWVKRGPLGADEVVLQDAAGQEHIFTFETFHNGYQALTLGLYKIQKPATASRLLIARA